MFLSLSLIIDFQHCKDQYSTAYTKKQNKFNKRYSLQFLIVFSIKYFVPITLSQYMDKLSLHFFLQTGLNQDPLVYNRHISLYLYDYMPFPCYTYGKHLKGHTHVNSMCTLHLHTDHIELFIWNRFVWIRNVETFQKRMQTLRLSNVKWDAFRAIYKCMSLSQSHCFTTKTYFVTIKMMRIVRR